MPLLILFGCGRPQVSSDAQFLAEIEQIPAIDNHAHPVCPPATAPGDRDFDALPVDNTFSPMPIISGFTRPSSVGP